MKPKEKQHSFEVITTVNFCHNTVNKRTRDMSAQGAHCKAVYSVSVYRRARKI